MWKVNSKVFQLTSWLFLLRFFHRFCRCLCYPKTVERSRRCGTFLEREYLMSPPKVIGCSDPFLFLMEQNTWRRISFVLFYLAFGHLTMFIIFELLRRTSRMALESELPDWLLQRKNASVVSTYRQVWCLQSNDTHSSHFILTGNHEFDRY